MKGIQWIDLKHGRIEMYIKSEHLVMIIVTALICITAIELYALHQGIDGAYLSAIIAVFGVIVGAVAKLIYDKKQ